MTGKDESGFENDRITPSAALTRSVLTTAFACGLLLLLLLVS